MATRSVSNADFTIERTYDAGPARVFDAWADPTKKARWFGAPEGAESERAFDFRVGGREHNAGTLPDGTRYTFDADYQNIVVGERIVYTYAMTMNGEPISVSVASIEFKAIDGSPDRARLILTEHGAFFDGLDNVGQREQGTRELLDALGKEIERERALT